MTHAPNFNPFGKKIFFLTGIIFNDDDGDENPKKIFG